MSDIEDYYKNLGEKHDKLLSNIKSNLSALKAGLEEAVSLSEDNIYRYYHHSFKVYSINNLTRNIIDLLRQISPHEDTMNLNKFFLEIWEDANSNAEFQREHNERWGVVNRAKVEAFFHAKYFLEQAIKYSHLEKAPQLLPSGWAALLHLYNIR